MGFERKSQGIFFLQNFSASEAQRKEYLTDKKIVKKTNDKTRQTRTLCMC